MAQDAPPFPLVTVHGSAALAAWKRLRQEGAGWPVILGRDEDLSYLADGFELDNRDVATVLESSRSLNSPHP